MTEQLGRAGNSTHVCCALSSPSVEGPCVRASQEYFANLLHAHTHTSLAYVVRASDCGCSSAYVRTCVSACLRSLRNDHKSGGQSILVLLGIFKTIAGDVCCRTVRMHPAHVHDRYEIALTGSPGLLCTVWVWVQVHNCSPHSIKACVGQCTGAVQGQTCAATSHCTCTQGHMRYDFCNFCICVPLCFTFNLLQITLNTECLAPRENLQPFTFYVVVTIIR